MTTTSFLWEPSVSWVLTLFVLSAWLFVANRHKTSPLEIKGTSYCAIEHFPGNSRQHLLAQVYAPVNTCCFRRESRSRELFLTDRQGPQQVGRRCAHRRWSVGRETRTCSTLFCLKCALVLSSLRFFKTHQDMLRSSGLSSQTIWWRGAQAAVSRRPRPAHNYRRFTIVQLCLLPTSRWATLGLAGLFTSLVLILGHPVHFQNRTITSQNSGTKLIFFCHMLISLGLPQLRLQHSVWRHYLITFCSQYLTF